MSEHLDAVLDRIDADLDAAIARLQALLAIPSISTDPAHTEDVARCAEHLAEDLQSMGMEAAAHQTQGHPMVLAHDDSAGPDAAHVLYYGHYDVQPIEPLDEWTVEPFAGTIVEGPAGPRIVARGAADDKGQLMTFVEAMRAWRSVHGSLPVRVTILCEGEEESGSLSLDPFLKEHRSALSADTCIICDCGMWDADTPAITSSLRGLVYLEATLHGPLHDLHSGMYGGAVVNPANALTEILGQLHDDQGRVQIEGFYDDVRVVDEAQVSQWNALGDADEMILRSSGSGATFGEAGYSTLERTWARPTCDINGLLAGYIGAGAKTVIGATASVKLSCRLVADQDPAAIETALVAFLETRTPPACRWEIIRHGASPAIAVPTDSPWLAAAADGLTAAFGTKAVCIGSGGSIPVAGSFAEILGIDAILLGFSLEDDLIHAPNEKYEVRSFRDGTRAQAAIMEALSGVEVPA